MRLLSLVLFALCLGATTARADVFDEACAYFQDRADSGAGNTVFRQHLSLECAEALAIYTAGPSDSDSRRMARAVLESMAEFRVVLEQITLARLARTYPAEMLHNAPPILRRPVSASGEVLIARVIGVTPRLSEWESWRLSQR